MFHILQTIPLTESPINKFPSLWHMKTVDFIFSLLVHRTRNRYRYFVDVVIHIYENVHNGIKECTARVGFSLVKLTSKNYKQETKLSSFFEIVIFTEIFSLFDISLCIHTATHICVPENNGWQTGNKAILKHRYM